MQIAEIKPQMAGINIRARVISKDMPRTVRSKRGAPLRVCDAILGDISGRIALTLWQKAIFVIKVGQVVDIKDAYATEYQGITKLTLGRHGRFEVVDDPSFPSIHDLLGDLREET
jgi:ssDNA-binding replication factor A large subunit